MTKLELAHYHERVAAWLLPELTRRPLSVVRFPQGVTGERFFQKHLHGRPPVGIETAVGPDGRTYFCVSRVEGLIGLVQRGVVELHTWGSRTPRLDRPDRLTLDLDPGPGVSWRELVAAALAMRGLLREHGLESFVRTTGGKGLHVVAPLVARCSWPALLAFARAAAVHLAAEEPERFTAGMSKSQRNARIFIDYLRNAVGATAVAAYSVRARRGAPVAMPLDWDELEPRCDLRGARFNVQNVPQLLEHRRDPWKRFGALRQTISRPVVASVHGS